MISTTVGSALTTVMVTVWPASSAPPPAPIPEYVTLPEPKSSSTVMSEMASNVGASLTAFTVIVNVCK